MFQYKSDSSHVKQNLISSMKNLEYELAQELPDA